MASQIPSSLTYRVKLHHTNKLSMPQIHLGLYMTSGKETSQIVQWALSAGYRGFDSAQMYHNERATGEGINAFLSSPENKSLGLQRSDIHYTTKLASNGGYDAARKSIEKSVKECNLGYIDLMLLHSPYGGRSARLETWRAVCDAVDEGLVRIGGVSNFGVAHVQELVESKPRRLPAVNQIEVHPFNTRTSIRDICAQHNIAIEAYGPLARALRMKHPKIVELSEKYGVSPGQLMVRWSVQHGLVPLPKSSNRDRIIQNGDVGGFEIEEADIQAMDALDEYLVTDWDPVDCP